MRIAITGGAGFLGSHLCEMFLSLGYQVVCIDNLVTGDLRNVSGFQTRPGFTLVRQDITEYISIEGDVDYVLHFASPASPTDYLRLPIQTLKAGALGSHKALGFAKAKGARFLLASTSEVYGDALVTPQTEEYWGNVNPLGPRGVYHEAKRFAEAMTMAYHRVHGLDTRIVRIFNAYGPRMRTRDGRAIPTFIGQALQGVPLTVHGDGSQLRGFCYISDMVEGIRRLMFSPVNDPVNLGNPETISIRELALTIIELTGSPSSLRFKPLPEEDPRARKPDISRARRLLGWEPRVGLKEGLQESIRWFRVEPGLGHRNTL